MKTTKFQNQLKRKDYFFNLFTFLFLTGSGFAQTFIPLPYSSDTYPYYYAASIFDLLVDKDNNGPSSGLKGVEGFRWWHDNDQSTEYMGMSLTWSAYNKANLWVKGDIYSQGNLTVASTNPNGQHDNFKVLVDDYKTQLISYGDENGLNISSDLGNKVYIGDSNDTVLFPGENIGIGIDSPQFKVHANGTIASDYNGIQVKLANNKTKTDGWIGTGSNHGLFIGTNGTGSNMYLDTSDNVYIGGVQPSEINTSKRSSYDLFVHKGILTEDYGIGPKATWADYVFNDTYKLKTLKEIDEFISVNKHLPNIPSQKSISENGYNLHEMNVRLLEKIEELMLYTINQQKELDKIKEDYQGLKNSIRNLEIKRH
ncbi:hypothetical protein [Flavobacterium lipolyticum]|uniref:Peptidase S74 domain-containing protein n=1 Tax=Flavobacterium lipolyticum TaxID=2893754 RepID=A0ABS8LYE4_9FLAO|nr:hypothetical protein [Flavobacterium sp. F-126]MCC9017607.1 hypothetical protein [Flavobacterium sp. F-126]